MNNFDNATLPSSRALELNNLGATLHSQGKIGAAYMHWLAALTIEPENNMFLQNTSAALIAMELYEMAAVVSRKAIKIDKNNQHSLSNYGVALLGMRQFKESREIFEKIVNKINNVPGFWHNYGLALYMSGMFWKAAEALKKSLVLQPDMIQVQSDYALSLMATGDLGNGLREYEIRWKTLYKSKIWDLGIPEWQGETLEGKNILIHHEQGFGDSLMLCRFINDARMLGANVTIAVPEELIRLFEENFSYAKVINWESSDINAEEFDFHSPMLSLMRWLNIKSIEDVVYFGSYLEAKSTVVNKGAFQTKLKIGLCWASGDHGAALRKRRRKLSLKSFLPLLEIPNVSLISLQKGDESNEIEAIGALGFIWNPMSRVDDFLGTAEVINDLDLVISVDSAVAHLAGVMGKPVLMLGPAPRCWRWWTKTNGSPWYKNMKIYSQSQIGSWTDAIENVINQVKYLSDSLDKVNVAAE